MRVREVELTRVQGMVAAQPLLAVLRGNGIEARAHGEALGMIYGLTVDGLGEVIIFVREDQVQQAQELLEAGAAGKLALPDEPSGRR